MTITALAPLTFGLRKTVERVIQHPFDTALEQWRSVLRIEEQKLKDAATLQGRLSDSLQSGALQGLAARQSLLDRRRLEAIEALWKAALVLHGVDVFLLQLFERFDMTKVSKSAVQEEKPGSGSKHL